MKPLPISMVGEPSVEHDALDRRVWGLGACVFIALLFCYAQVLAGMVGQWWNISFYSYAFLIPVVSAYLVWIRRDQVLAIMPRPHYTGGIVLIAAGLSILIVGQAGGVQAFQQISLMITLAGMVVFLLGPAVLKAVWLPLMFLWFMIPIWEVLTDPLHLPFQAFSANAGVMLLRAVGIPVFQDGVFIHLPNITLEVARACSGVNYLIAVLATSIPLATIVLTDVRKRIVLVLLAMAVSALANSLRVALIGVLAYYDLSGDLHGPYHTLHGIFVSLVGYVVIFGGLWVLSRGQPGNSSKEVAPASFSNMWNIKWERVRTAWTVLTVVLVLVGAFRYIDRSQPVPLRHSLSEFSLESAGWTGRDALLTEKIQGADQSLSRVYRAASGEEVKLSIWYFEAQTQGKELVSGGTARLHAGATKVKGHLGRKGNVDVNRVLRHDGERTEAVLFWYDLNGRIVAGQPAAKFFTVLDSLVRGRTNGALVLVAADLPSGDQHEKERALATLTKFVSDLYPALYSYLPSSAE